MDIIITIIYPEYNGHYYYNYLSCIKRTLLLQLFNPVYNGHYHYNYLS